MNKKINGKPVGFQQTAPSQVFKGERPMFSKRFMSSDPKAALAILARTVAKLVAEDINTAYYIKDYTSGNFTCRQDYIDYMANRIEFELKNIGVK